VKNQMIKSEDYVIWVNPDDKVVRVTGRKSPVSGQPVLELLVAYKPKEVHLG
jgi:hypothetical protein